MPRKSDFLSKKQMLTLKKIDSSALATFGMVIAAFSVNDKDRKVRFFEEIFLLADISSDVIF